MGEGGGKRDRGRVSLPTPAELVLSPLLPSASPRTSHFRGPCHPFRFQWKVVQLAVPTLEDIPWIFPAVAKNCENC